MKVVRQIRLELREGTSDKVYEVDLCEVGPGRFVVNFRFGRRGARLQEGSKTPLAVARTEADRVYDKLVAEKTDKGYHEAGTVVTPVVDEPAAVATGVLQDLRHHHLLELLAAGGRGGWAPVDRIVYRAGELRVREAAPWIARVASGASDRLVSDRLAWNVARALLRCGDPATVGTAIELWRDSNRPGWVQTLARHAVFELSGPEDRQKLVDEARTQHGLDDLYLTEDRSAFLERLRTVGMLGESFGGVRRVYKAAEAKGDGEVWGLLARRIEREKCGGTPTPGQSSAAGRFAMRFKRKASNRPSGGTRKYLRRRTWRALRRLGEARMAGEYARMAVGLLLAYTDADHQSGARGPWYAQQWALAQILFSGGKGWSADGMKLKIRYRPGSGREERFPELWDEAPEALAELLDRSRLAEVHAFATRALRANRPAWSAIPIPRLVGWFSAPYPETGAFAAEVAITRYDPKDPDTDLVLALLTSPHPVPRQTAEQWVRANPAPFLGNTSFVTGIVLSPRVETRRFALELLGGATLRPDHAKRVVDAVVERALRLEVTDAEGDLVLRDAAAILVAGFAQELAKLPLEQVAALVRHPSAGVAELGAKILLGHEVRPPSLPDDLLAAAMTSVHPVVRGIGIRLYGELPDAVLAERFRVLVHLIVNPNPDVRYAVAPIVIRLAGTNPGFAKVLMSALVPLLVGEGAEGMHRDVVRLLRTELAVVLPLVDAGQVFRMLRADETVVQELGGDLLRTNVEPASMTAFQLGILAGSDVLGVRNTAFAMLAHRVDAVRADPESVLPLVDARWEESRTRAFAYVEEQVGLEHVPAAVALAVCDSVRPDVQAFGRKLVARSFDHAEGPRYLLRLAQHPSPDMQAFAASWLEQHAAGDPERLAKLVPFFVSVLARPNKGRVAKVRVLQFLESQLSSAACAEVLAPVLSELVLTVASSQRARYVEMLTTLRHRHPQIATPLRVIEPEVRGAV